MGRYEKCLNPKVAKLQKRSDSGTLCFSAPQPNIDVSCHLNSNKSPQMHKSMG